MTGRIGQRLGTALFCLELVLASIALFLVLTLVPTKRYVPMCGWPDGHMLHGPMREQYVGLLAQAMAEDGFRHMRNGNTLLVPVWPIFDGNGRWDWIDFQLNVPWRIALNIGQGVTVGAHQYRPPAPVLRLLEGAEGPYGPYPKQVGSGPVTVGGDRRYREDCNLFRAAVLKVEAMPSEALPDLNAIDRARHARTAERPVPRP